MAAAGPHLLFLDTNLLVSAIKSPGKGTESLRLLLLLLARGDVELVGNPVLVEEYIRYAREFASPTAARIVGVLLGKLRLLDPEERFLRACAPLLPAGQAADCAQAATCLQTGAVLISGDRHFDRVARAELVRRLTISEAIHAFLGEDAK